MNTNTSTLPKTGIEGLRAHWRNDLIAAFSVTLVAFPLSLGIALASGVPPMAGIISAVIGGVVTTFLRGSYLAINGPAAGLIVVILTGVESLKDENGSGFPYVLAAIVIAGGIQMVLGLLKLGKLGELVPIPVVHGMLAAIGIIIIGKQAHVALGVDLHVTSTLEVLLNIPMSFINQNPFVALITFISLLILIYYPRLKYRVIQFFPGTMWVLICSIPLVFLFDFFNVHDLQIFNKSFHVGPEYLIHIPENLKSSFIFPNFSKINEPVFWITVISITLVASIVTLISTTAIDKLDTYKRRTNLNKDLVAVGFSSLISGFIGGLPIISVIVRSSVNINHGAKTKWSNLYQSLIIFALVFFFPFIIQEIPKAALAAILIYTGYKLAGPRVFKEAMLKGWEQLIILFSTVVFSLVLGLLFGIFLGICVTLLIHYFKLQIPYKSYINYLLNPSIHVISDKDNKKHIKVKGVANFFNILKIVHEIKKIPANDHIIIDFSHTKLVDSTILDFIYEHKEKYYSLTENYEIIGLDMHKVSSSHPLALHVLEKPKRKRLTHRQFEINKFSKNLNSHYSSEIRWNTTQLKEFAFFEPKIIQYENNIVEGKFTETEVGWEISDVTFDEGALMATDVFHVTNMKLNLPEKIPRFLIIKENSFKCDTALKNFNNGDTFVLKEFTNKYIVKTNDVSLISKFLTDKLIEFLVKNDSYNIESTGGNILIYKSIRLASPKEIADLHLFSQEFCEIFVTK